MSENSKIEWTDHTFNPWIGCTKVSPGCAHCYAESEDKRRGWTAEGWGKGKPRKRTSAAYWRRPRVWNQVHGYRGSNERQRVFCASLADWLDDEVPIEWLADLLALIHATQNLDWLLLTKRPENFIPRLNAVIKFVGDTFRKDDSEITVFAHDWLAGQAPNNVWIGTSVEDQERANLRIPALLKIPARVRFLSCEPLLGSVNLKSAIGNRDWPEWVIVGGESGPKARECNVRWQFQIVAQCKWVGIPVFVKQLGAYVVDRNDAGFDGETEREWPMGTDTRDIVSGYQGAPVRVLLRNGKGGDMSEWPEYLRVREFPSVYRLSSSAA